MRDYVVGNYTMKGYDLHQDEDPVEQYKGQYSTHLFTEKAIDVINNHDKSKVRRSCDPPPPPPHSNA